MCLILSYGSPVEWCRAATIHRHMAVEKDLIMNEVGLLHAKELPLSIGEAARAGLLHLVYAHLHRGQQPNTRDRVHPKYTPLHRAVSGGHRNIMRLLLSKGAIPTIRDRLGFSALHFAANQSPEIASDLIQARCEVNAVNLAGITPLHSAAGLGRADICKLLLGAGARVINKHGKSPVHLALRAAERRAGAERQSLLSLADMLRDLEASQAEEADLQKTWCFQDIGDKASVRKEAWTPLDAEATALLEHARVRGETEVYISVGGSFRYHIDLDQQTQTNMDTGSVGHISLRPTASLETGWARLFPVN